MSQLRPWISKTRPRQRECSLLVPRTAPSLRDPGSLQRYGPRAGTRACPHAAQGAGRRLNLPPSKANGAGPMAQTRPRRQPRTRRRARCRGQDHVALQCEDSRAATTEQTLLLRVFCSTQDCPLRSIAGVCPATPSPAGLTLEGLNGLTWIWAVAPNATSLGPRRAPLPGTGERCHAAVWLFLPSNEQLHLARGVSGCPVSGRFAEAFNHTAAPLSSNEPSIHTALPSISRRSGIHTGAGSGIHGWLMLAGPVPTWSKPAPGPGQGGSRGHSGSSG